MAASEDIELDRLLAVVGQCLALDSRKEDRAGGDVFRRGDHDGCLNLAGSDQGFVDAQAVGHVAWGDTYRRVEPFNSMDDGKKCGSAALR